MRYEIHKTTHADDKSAYGTEASLRFAIWITWEIHARTRNIASHIGVHLDEIIVNKRGLRRYIPAVLRTVSSLIAKKPRVLIVQNPSLILTALVLFLRPLLRYRLVVDAHNEAVEPYMHSGKAMLWLSGFCIRNADLTIVTNQFLAKIVNEAGGKALVLPDKVPEYSGIICDGLSSTLNVVMIATYASDEPIKEFLEAAGVLEDQLTIFITGRAEKLPEEIRMRVSPNVRFTGFLDEQRYWELLAGADAIVDLTLKDNCLVCGAYEGIAVGKPLILSDSEATRAHFNKGVLYVDNTASGIRRALESLREDRIELKKQAIELRDELRGQWVDDAGRLVAAICALG